ncbi:acetyl-CoA C-acyltransferase [Olivibacter sitiensis]|uniref:acetyl-CoA C-acyltransferase n=1 Tax=Olivibacter sitiensis TaxID=376470 RepID=UPI0004076A5D|nr:acetyl-CoA C-acyltransferase [Olivibacter sitiensis]
MSKKDVFIVAACRTPIGSFIGQLSEFTATQLGGLAVADAIKRAAIAPHLVQEIFFGNVLSANLGQAPATQVAKLAGLGNIPATTINKVCASGTKAIMLAAQSVASGDNEIAVAAGAESMSNVPYYLDKARKGFRLGHQQMTDGLIKDGLWDVYNDYHMGSAAELCARHFNISRLEQDEYATSSYQKAQTAQKNQLFKGEILPVEWTDKKGNSISLTDDEEIYKVQFEKIPQLSPVFEPSGTVTAANASTLNDGAAALILASGEAVERYALTPIAKILSFADAQQDPEWFTTSPTKAISLALNKIQLNPGDADFYEINEAFSVVALANNRLLGLDPKKVNVYGGAVALGHPLGASGARIVVTLLSVLSQEQGRLGVAGICNGGGGASALVLERI